jgi:hypothetical protein
MWKAITLMLVGALGAAFAVHAVFAQGGAMPHAPMPGGSMPPDHGYGSMSQNPSMHHMAGMPGTSPTMPGQDAFAAIAEVVRLLDADPQTDWSKVDLERLRQHLIDMNEVVLRSEVKQTPVPGGLAMEITGTGRTERAIRAMVVPHAAELDRMPAWSARTEPIAGGIRLIIVAKKPDDAKAVARIRGLGFAGLITEGAHHQPHHLAMAKGEALAGHTH